MILGLNETIKHLELSKSTKSTHSIIDNLRYQAKFAVATILSISYLNHYATKICSTAMILAAFLTCERYNSPPFYSERKNRKQLLVKKYLTNVKVISCSFFITNMFE